MEADEPQKTFAEIKEAVARPSVSDVELDRSRHLEHDLVHRHLLGAASRFELSTAALSDFLGQLEQISNKIAAGIPSDSRNPIGSLLHRLLKRINSRQVTHNQQIAKALQTTLSALTQETKRLFEAQRSADERQIQDLLASIVERFATIDSLQVSVTQLEKAVRSDTPAGNHG